MMLVEQTTVPSIALPVAEFKDHLLLGTGFADDGSQDAILENYLRAAIAAIEARTGKVLVSKQYTWTLTAWREASHQPLPLAPVFAIDALRIIDRTDVATIVDATGYVLEKDMHRPKLWASGYSLASIPIGGTAEIDFWAGYGAAWSDVPVDLGQATYMLASHFYENRSATSGSDGAVPFGVSALIERYRNIRIIGGIAR
jgi:uncharacterized phiE125 gp8 family phage protein